MEIIHVPGPPKVAFNKGRRISDLIRAQVDHLKHLEYKLPASVRAQLPQHEITTEDDAARYIAPMTGVLRAQVAAPAAVPGPVAVPARKPRAVPVGPQGLAIAASGDSEEKHLSAKSVRKSGKRAVKGKKR